jgi:hypothetical protein
MTYITHLLCTVCRHMEAVFTNTANYYHDTRKGQRLKRWARHLHQASIRWSL